MEDIIQLAITMTEMDTGLTLSPQERQDMVDRIMAKVEGLNRQCTARCRGRFICSISPPNQKTPYNVLMKELIDIIFAVIISIGILMVINKIS